MALVGGIRMSNVKKQKSTVYIVQKYGRNNIIGLNSRSLSDALGKKSLNTKACLWSLKRYY